MAFYSAAALICNLVFGSGFWRALGVIVAAKIGFFVLDAISDSVWWRLKGRERVVDSFVEFLAVNKMPFPGAAVNNYCEYLGRVAYDTGMSQVVRNAAAQAKEF